MANAFPGGSFLPPNSSTMDSKKQPSINHVDEKAIIWSLIRENSDRIKLVEFKDARADIWQNFRLVQLDGQIVAYAVCIKCLKPVSYKAREGTGGLHRHPCSKMTASASAGSNQSSNSSALSSFGSLPHGPKSAASSASSSSNARQSISSPSLNAPSPSSQTSSKPPAKRTSGGIKRSASAVEEEDGQSSAQNSILRTLLPLQLANAGALASPLVARSFALRSLATQLLASQAHLELAQLGQINPIGNQNVLQASPQAAPQQNSSPPVCNDDEEVGKQIISFFCKQLIPLDILMKRSSGFFKLAELFISIGATFGAVGFESFPIDMLMDIHYDATRTRVQSVLAAMNYVPFVVDIWRQESSDKRFLTLWYKPPAMHPSITYATSLPSSNLMPPVDKLAILETREIHENIDASTLFGAIETLRKTWWPSNSSECGRSKSEQRRRDKRIVYLFDNEYDTILNLQPHDSVIFCVLHILDGIFRRALNPIQELNELLSEMKKICLDLDIHPTEQSDGKYDESDTWFNKLHLFTIVMEHWDDVQQHVVSRKRGNFQNGTNSNSTSATNINEENEPLIRMLYEFFTVFTDAYESFSQEPSDTDLTGQPTSQANPNSSETYAPFSSMIGSPANLSFNSPHVPSPSSSSHSSMNVPSSNSSSKKTLHSSTLNLVYLWKVKLEDHCKPDPGDSSLLQVIKENLKEQFATSCLNHPLYLMAVCLDPRFKRMKMCSEETRFETYEAVRQALRDLDELDDSEGNSGSSSSEPSPPGREIKCEDPLDPSPSSSGSSNSPSASSRRKKTKPRPRGAFGTHGANSGGSTDAFTEYLDTACERPVDELQRYLNLEIGQVQPLQFWTSDHASVLPRLRQLALELLSVPAAGFSCCRFSAAARKLNVRRKSLPSKFLDQALFLHSNCD